jgi:hypothetical protein
MSDEGDSQVTIRKVEDGYKQRFGYDGIVEFDLALCDRSSGSFRRHVEAYFSDPWS